MSLFVVRAGNVKMWKSGKPARRFMRHKIRAMATAKNLMPVSVECVCDNVDR